MSDGPSTRDHRITKSYFRTCSTYMSRSQAPLYLYALHAIANRIEGTFELLRYLLGKCVRLARGTLYRISGMTYGSIHFPKSSNEEPET